MKHKLLLVICFAFILLKSTTSRAQGCQYYYRDFDGDGYGGLLIPAVFSCTGAPGGYVSNHDDCNDNNPNAHPGAAEVTCNGIDDNCDGNVDEGTIYTYYFRDYDGDGFGGLNFPGVSSCNGAPPGYVLNHDDCDDNNPNTHPGAAEVPCNQLDDNCDGQVDEGTVYVYYYHDLDGDGYGSFAGGPAVSSCNGAPAGYSANFFDCDDGNPNRHPGAAEVCNGLDDNCNGLVDEDLVHDVAYFDADHDGYGGNTSIELCPGLPLPPSYSWDDGDCNDADPNIHPGAAEICNGIDDNCNGLVDEDLVHDVAYFDADHDGYGGNTSIELCPGLPLPPSYSWDDGDCNDADPNIHPGAAEICNGIDDNCNGQYDEGLTFTTYYKDYDGDGYGNNISISACEDPGGNWVLMGGDCDDDPDPNGIGASIHPGAPEMCNHIDDNCNGQVDEGFPTTTLYRDGDGDGLGNPFDSGSFTICDNHNGFVDNSADCNDYDVAVRQCTPFGGVGPIGASFAGQIGVGSDPKALKIVVDTSGNAYIIGNFILSASFNTSSLTSMGGNDVFIAKINSSGALQWVTQIGGAGEENGTGITYSNSAGNIFVTGITHGSSLSFISPSASAITRTSIGSSDFFVAKINSFNGNIIAAEMSGATSTGAVSDKTSSSIGVSPDGNSIYVCGGLSACGNGSYGGAIPDRTSCGSPFTPFLSRYDENCNLAAVLKPQVINNNCNDAMLTGIYVQPTMASNYANQVFVSGFTAGRIKIGNDTIGETGKTDPFYASYSPGFSNGNTPPTRVKWVSNGGGKSTELTVNDSGYVYLLHYTFNDDLNSCSFYFNDSLSDAYLTKFDKTNTNGCLWNRRLATYGDDKFESIANGKGDTVFIAGSTNGSPFIGTTGFTNKGGYDGFLAKYDGSGNDYWIVDVGGSGEDFTHSVATDQHGVIYIVGSLKNSTITIDTISVSNPLNETHGYIFELGEISSEAMLNINLRVFIEGYYIQGADSMRAVIDPDNFPTLCDTLTLQLADSATLQRIAINKNVISTHGQARFTFRLADLIEGHRYYIVIDHRNAMETWSKYSILFDKRNYSFDFTR